MTGALPPEGRLRRDVVEACRRLHERGLIGAGEGNVSCRLGPDRLLVTPSGANKGFLRPEDLLVVDAEGRVVRGRGRPSTELRMHLAAYRARPDAGAVVHAHPLTAVAFTVAGLPPPNAILPEAVLVLGEVAVAPFATPGTDEVPRSLAGLWRGREVLLLERHGALALGRDVFQAFDRVETLERVCRVALAARLLGRCEPLPPDAVDGVRRAGQALARGATSRTARRPRSRARSPRRSRP
ncbi:MAG TPA: class II aldolase/adducin family protein [Anaeromyxobacteraceae bacterium]|nr:class II aldolase/adducin family protein [Anaeromyxobacteraceae bacterium]